MAMSAASDSAAGRTPQLPAFRRAGGLRQVRGVPTIARLTLLSGAALLTWVLSRHPAAGDLLGFFKGVGVEVGAANRDARNYRLDNSQLKSGSAGMAYRKTKNVDDIVTGEGESWDGVITGVDEGDGWLRVGADRYLPFESDGVPILATMDEDEESWKDEAWRRQQERIQYMKKKMDPNYRKSSQELIEQQRRKAVWKAMSTRNTESVFDGDGDFGTTNGEGMLITVSLAKPLGINFLEVNPNDPCGALVGDLADGYSAKACNMLQVGDVLIKVDGASVAGRPLEEALQPIIDKEGTVELTFFRAD